MQAGVMFGILITLLNKRIATRQYLADKFEMSTRTIGRYIDKLAEGGVPVYSLRGVNGGYTIPDDYRMDKSYFTIEELGRIISSLEATRSGFNDKQNDIIIDKITNLKNFKTDEKYFLKSQTLIIDTGTWNNPQKFRNKISVINKAIEQNRTITMSYTDKNDTLSTREFAPYCLALKEGIWYTIGWCYYRNDYRLFKLARINNMSLTENTFVRNDYDVFQKLNENFQDKDLVDIKLEFWPNVRAEIEEWLGSDAIIQQDDKFIASASLYGGNELKRKILSFGSEVKVLSPAILKEEILVECKRIDRSYSER